MGVEVEHFASGQDLVFHRTTQNHVKEVLRVFMPMYDARRD